ncbi:MAG: diaminopimelate epimerase [Bacteroidia bacterium]|jgi:diaminopimelate epimerase|nr:diaminopimelate epimerase [Bacteroidia bacterium]
MEIAFYKYQGTGNDFIMIDDRESLFPVENTKLVAQLCDRRFGIGADGLILLQQHPQSAFYMKYYNADGNESSMCGNGGRCIAAFAHYLGIASEHARFDAIDGLHEAIIQPLPEYTFIKLKMMNVASVQKLGNQTFSLNTGSPHYVQFLQESVHELDLIKEAKRIRYNDTYAAAGINVNFGTLQDDLVITLRTYERGVEDETLSCGTGVTAAALCLALVKQLPSGNYAITVKAMGGELKVSYDFDAEAVSFSNIWLQGPATFVFKGKYLIG